MGTLALEVWKDSYVLWRSCLHLLQWVLPISIAQNILNQKYFGRISVCSVSSLLLHLPWAVCGSLHLMLSLLVCHSTWKSWFLDVPQKSLLPVVKWLKLIYFFLFFKGHQIWTSPYLQQSTSHDLLSHQHPATKDSIKLPSLETWLAPHTDEPQERPCLSHRGPSTATAMHSRDTGASLDNCLMLAAVPGDRQGDPWCDLATDRAEAKNGTILKLSIWSEAAADNSRQSQGTGMRETSCGKLNCISNRTWMLAIQFRSSGDYGFLSTGDLKITGYI